MNWINPRVTLPKVGRIYLVIFAHNNSRYIALSSACYDRKWNYKTDTDETDKSKMYWDSLYGSTRTKAASVIAEIGEEYRRLGRTDTRSYYFLEKIPTEYPILGAVAYIAVEDIDYPVELMKSHCTCDCANKTTADIS